MKSGVAAGAVAGVVGGIVGIIFGFIGYFARFYGVGPVPLTDIVATQIVLTIIFGAIFGTIYSKLYDSIPGKGVRKGLNFGLMIWLIGCITSGTYVALHYGDRYCDWTDLRWVLHVDLIRSCTWSALQEIAYRCTQTTRRLSVATLRLQ